MPLAHDELATSEPIFYSCPSKASYSEIVMEQKQNRCWFRFLNDRQKHASVSTVLTRLYARTALNFQQFITASACLHIFRTRFKGHCCDTAAWVISLYVHCVTAYCMHRPKVTNTTGLIHSLLYVHKQLKQYWQLYYVRLLIVHNLVDGIELCTAELGHATYCELFLDNVIPDERRVCLRSVIGRLYYSTGTMNMFVIPAL